jgi:hypothetical protein
MARCLTLALALLLHLVTSSNEALTVEECTTVIMEAYGRQDLDKVLRETFGPIKQVKEREGASLEKCLAICRKNSECEKAIRKLDMKRSNTRKFLLGVKMSLKILVGHRGLLFVAFPMGSACDLAQFWLHLEHPILERVIGAVGNVLYGALVGYDLGGATEAVIGGVIGLSLWLYSEFFYYK